MYCSSCGVSIAQSLSYCNFCGAKVSRGESLSRPTEVRPESLIQAMGAIFICGLLATTVLIGVMKAVLGLEAGQILPFAIVSFLMIIIIEGVLIRLLLRRTQEIAASVETVMLKGQTTRELDAAGALGLTEPVASVTEHTTRAFDPTLQKL